ncbi:hypothetical protein [Archangium lansingense]|uniref:Uncharacterized protein n=1 Tax=Archangium lansingense TaxID=2995310 RepID=A0ABT3ZZJ6_9BACT|nr:hypothetical protein [Archangium lansinium]MCY1074832.1 hypothetical protein [Archangium lansinium]
MKAPGASTRRRLGVALVAALGLLAPMARAEEPPRVTCSATRVGRRVVVRPEALALVAPELERLMRLGLAGRLEVELTLLRRRPLWFSERMDAARLTQVLVYSAKEGGWVLDGRLLAGVGTLELERVAWTLEEEPEAEATFVVEVGVRLQVVTAASLGKVAQWLTQGEKTEAERSALTRGLLRTVAEDLTRRAEGRCNVQSP